MTNNKVLMIAAGAVITGMILFLSFLLAALQLAEPEIIDKPINSQNEKIEKDSFDLWLDKLANYECPDCGPRFKRLDSNGKFSYSCLQFQFQTFVSMARRYGFAPKEGPFTLDIFDCKLQKQIAKAMFKEDPIAASFHWQTSIYIKGLGLPPEA